MDPRAERDGTQREDSVSGDLSLDQRFRRALRALTLCSHAATANLQGASSHGALGSIDLSGGDDGGTRHWERRYGEQIDDHGRRSVIEELERDVAHHRRRQAPLNAQDDDPDVARRHLLEQTAGWSPAEVEQSGRATARVIRRLRRQEGLDPETGQTRQHLSPGERRAEVLRLHELGKTRYEIAMLLGMHKETVSRITHGDRRAAA